jgi:hypothetical protein
MNILEVFRDADDYEREYCGLTELVCGYYVVGHEDEQAFVDAVLGQHPDVLVDVHHWGWLGRFLKHGEINDSQSLYQPHRPSARDVVHTYWRGVNSFGRARPGTRGAYPVTYLPVEGMGSVWDLSDVWDGAWVPFLPEHNDVDGGQGE